MCYFRGFAIHRVPIILGGMRGADHTHRGKEKSIQVLPDVRLETFLLATF